MVLYSPGNGNVRLLDHHAGYLDQIPGTGAPQLLRLPVERQVHQRIVTDGAAQLDAPAHIGPQSPAQDLDIIAGGQRLRLLMDLLALRIRVGHTAAAPPSNR